MKEFILRIESVIHLVLLILCCGAVELADAKAPEKAKVTIGSAVVYDRSSKYDHSFNQAAYENGVLPLREQGYTIKEVEPANHVQTQLGVMKLARRGYNPIVGVGYAVSPAIERAAKAFPDTSFVIIDSVIHLPNVRSVTFQEEQGAYLAGVLAALKTKKNHIGFVGGMDIPLIRKFSCGYALGAKTIKPDIRITRHYVGSTSHAWDDPSKGIEIARHQYEQGADVIFAAAGGSGLGVYQAANDHNFYAIAVDSNQNHLYPGAVLSSMVKSVGKVVWQSIVDFNTGQWQAGHQQLGLAGDWVGLTRDKYNGDVFSLQLASAVNEHKRALLQQQDPRKTIVSLCAQEIN
ncbi:BMP family ABC transporter substrate-binding protein [Psychrobium sp. MM17-31]|uniref:BMP family ABC transporter substrate-binding protein n=1 Tax=Psychrobium sp. MM17-31 TaxID=2917758 RepID=UPI001EF43C20|nr:BMP family ABC transporter substrate-binding protein [Psychrobium sp. MM17-31]